MVSPSSTAEPSDSHSHPCEHNGNWPDRSRLQLSSKPLIASQLYGKLYLRNRPFCKGSRNASKAKLAGSPHAPRSERPDPGFWLLEIPVLCPTPTANHPHENTRHLTPADFIRDRFPFSGQAQYSGQHQYYLPSRFSN